mgnify:CR=1 FL=1
MISKDPDLHSSSKYYLKRFEGDVGEWFLEVQKKSFLRALFGLSRITELNIKVALQKLAQKNIYLKSVLDVGGGHGQIAKIIEEVNKIIEEKIILEEKRLKEENEAVFQKTGERPKDIRERKGSLEFKLSSPIQKIKINIVGTSRVAFEVSDEEIKDYKRIVSSFEQIYDQGVPVFDKSFDLVTCFRILPHYDDWKELIRELCRVSNHYVIIDFPTKRSFNIFYPLLFKFKKGVEKSTREYLIFSEGEIIEEFKKNGFILESRIPQFFMPMGAYRAISKKLKLQIISELIEDFFELTGLTKLFGSPVISCFKRRD